MQRASRVTMAGFAAGGAMVLMIGGLWLVSANAPSWHGAISTMLRERRGQEVYNANCFSCHLGPTGGRIEDSPSRHNANGHTWHHPDCALERMVREGSDGISGAVRSDGLKMQPFKDRLSPEDIGAVLAYIKTMWTPGQREAQASFTREMCFEGSN